MKQLNVSKKVTAPLVVWVSIALIAATLLFSFMPIMCFDTSTGNEMIDEFVDKIVENSDIEIPEKIEITAGKLISSVRVIAKSIKVASASIKEAQGTDANADEAVEELNALLETDAGKETLLVAAAVACTFMQSTNSEESSGTGAIVATTLSMIFMLAVLVLIFVIPIRLIIMLIKSLIAAFTNMDTPEVAAPKIANKLSEDMLAVPFFMMIMQTFIPNMTYGWGLIAITITVAFSVLFSTVISRLRTYETKKFMYLNVVQGVSVVSIVGFFVFFFNIVKTNVINNFIQGDIFKYLKNVKLAKDAVKYTGETITINNAYLVDVVMILVFMGIFFGSAAYITHSANRLSCTINPKEKENKFADCKIGLAIVTLATYILPTYVAGQKHFFNDVTSTEKIGDSSLLIFNDTEAAALKTALIGIIIMIVAEVALIVLKKVLCKGLTALEASAIVCGRDDDNTVAAPVAEEASAEAPAEEAPVAEEVSAE